MPFYCILYDNSVPYSEAISQFVLYTMHTFSSKETCANIAYNMLTIFLLYLVTESISNCWWSHWTYILIVVIFNRILLHARNVQVHTIPKPSIPYNVSMCVACEVSLYQSHHVLGRPGKQLFKQIMQNLVKALTTIPVMTRFFAKTQD